MKYIKVKPNNRNYVTPEMISEAKIVIVKNENTYTIRKYSAFLFDVGDRIHPWTAKNISNIFPKVLIYDETTRKILKKNF